MCEYEPENRTALAFTEAGILFQLYTAHLLQGLKNRQYTKERKKKKNNSNLWENMSNNEYKTTFCVPMY